MASDPVPAVPRPAATVVLLRDGAAGVEALLLRRVEREGDRSSGAWVFPGGTLDARDAAAHPCCHGLDDAQASARLSLARGGLDYFVAAIRECFEEAGVLLGVDATGRSVAADARWPALRRALRARELDAAGVAAALGVRLDAQALAYHGHWLTPAGLPKRFDTRFFVAAMPPGQEAAHDAVETEALRWLAPAAALQAPDLRLPNATRHTLRALAGFARVADALAHAQARREIARILPAIADGPQGLRPVQPDEPAYAEVLRVDPLGRGRARYAIEPGRAVALSARVRRVTAANAGMMTGPGTNTYLVGGADSDAWTVIDPGPDDAAHVEAVLAAAAPRRIAAILVTHTHHDHSPAARALHARTGAPCWGRAARHGARQDTAFRPARELAHGERLALAADATLRVLHTPGHAANHLCYLLEEERLLFTGDHVMQGSTVVIDPPDGDMAQYLASLEALRGEDLDALAPGHGFLVAEPRAAIERLIRHRRLREAKVRRALDAGITDPDELLSHVYDDVPAARHGVARRSLLAHLIALGCAPREG